MIRGLYTSTMGMTNNEKRMEVISNNLANINTTGYKKDSALSTTFSEVMTEMINGSQSNEQPKNIGELSLGIGIDDVVTDYTQGTLLKTDNPLDLALTGSNLAFFSIDVTNPQTKQSQEMYTRDGAFTINTAGQLVTKDGAVVKGEKGPIVLDGSNNVSISSDGTIYQNGQAVDKLLIKEFKDSKGLKKYGNNLIMDAGNSQTNPFSGQIKEGFLENSNVNSITEMVDMITTMRSYEASQKVIQQHDGMLQKAVNEVGKL